MAKKTRHVTSWLQHATTAVAESIYNGTWTVRMDNAFHAGEPVVNAAVGLQR